MHRSFFSYDKLMYFKIIRYFMYFNGICGHVSDVLMGIFKWQAGIAQG